MTCSRSDRESHTSQELNNSLSEFITVAVLATLKRERNITAFLTLHHLSLEMGFNEKVSEAVGCEIAKGRNWDFTLTGGIVQMTFLKCALLYILPHPSIFSLTEQAFRKTTVGYCVKTMQQAATVEVRRRRRP